jgi:hypothetical protein
MRASRERSGNPLGFVNHLTSWVWTAKARESPARAAGIARVISTNEALMIARHTGPLLGLVGNRSCDLDRKNEIIVDLQTRRHYARDIAERKFYENQSHPSSFSFVFSRPSLGATKHRRDCDEER